MQNAGCSGDQPHSALKGTHGEELPAPRGESMQRAAHALSCALISGGAGLGADASLSSLAGPLAGGQLSLAAAGERAAAAMREGVWGKEAAMLRKECAGGDDAVERGGTGLGSGLALLEDARLGLAGAAAEAQERRAARGAARRRGRARAGSSVGNERTGPLHELAGWTAVGSMVAGVALNDDAGQIEDASMAEGEDAEVAVHRIVPGAPAEPALAAAHPFLSPAIGMGRVEGSSSLSSSVGGTSSASSALALCMRGEGEE